MKKSNTRIYFQANCPFVLFTAKHQNLDCSVRSPGCWIVLVEKENNKNDKIFPGHLTRNM